jgi:hypothetical protein
MSQTTTQIQTLHIPTSIPSHIATTTSAPQSAQIPQFANFNYYLAPSASSPQSAPSTDDLELILGTKNQDTRRLPVHDLRGQFDQFQLDRNGFEVVRLESEEEEFGDDETIRRVYYPEIEGLVRGL